MKHLFSVLMVAMIFATASFAQTNGAAASGAKMAFEKTTVDYGTIAQNSDPYRVFKFTNTGTEPLIITSAKGSCGCTVPTYPKEPIAPGASSEIKVRYDTKRIGAINKSVTLQTNAGVQVLKIKGTVNAAPASPTAPVNEKKSILDQ